MLEGLVNLGPWLAAVTVAGEPVRTPPEVIVAPDGLGVPEGLANLGACPAAMTVAGELVLAPVVTDVDGII